MSIIAGIILLIITTRFVYIDSKYQEIIKKYEMELAETDNGNINRELCLLEIGKYQIKREDNRHFGFKLDILSLSSIIILGSITVFGIFESVLELLVLLLFSFSIFPVIHFWRHLSSINKEKSI